MIDGEGIPPVPLEQRTCIALMSAGILGSDGSHPVCLGRTCSKWESCEYDRVAASLELDKIRQHPRHRRIEKHGWGGSR